MTISEIASKLIADARSRGEDTTQAFSKMLDYFLDVFDLNRIAKADGNMIQIFTSAQKENPLFFELMTSWLMSVDKAMRKGEVLDWFGNVYEECFQGKSKAQALGQYFTPQNIFDLASKCCMMGNMTQSQSCNEPSCGSGRGLLSAWNNAGRPKTHYYVGEDIDAMSVKMCALNLMAHGLYGKVLCHDTLSEPASYRFGYIINEVKYPIPTEFLSIRLITQK